MEGNIILMEIDNYVFDLYGTLIDIHTDEWRPKTWKKFIKVLDDRKIKHPAYYQLRADHFRLDRAYRKKALEDGPFKVPEIDILPVFNDMFVSYGNAPMSKEQLWDIAAAFRVVSRDYYRLFPGVEEYFEKLHKLGKKVYILSNAQASYTVQEIENFGLDKITDGYIISSDYGCMKPDKAFYDALVKKYKLDISKTLMHGDSYENDYKGALEAGWQAVHLSGVNHPSAYYLNQIKNGSSV